MVALNLGKATTLAGAGHAGDPVRTRRHARGRPREPRLRLGEAGWAILTPAAPL